MSPLMSGDLTVLFRPLCCLFSLVATAHLPLSPPTYHPLDLLMLWFPPSTPPIPLNGLVLPVPRSFRLLFLLLAVVVENGPALPPNVGLVRPFGLLVRLPSLWIRIVDGMIPITSAITAASERRSVRLPLPLLLANSPPAVVGACKSIGAASLGLLFPPIFPFSRLLPPLPN